MYAYGREHPNSSRVEQIFNGPESVHLNAILLKYSIQSVFFLSALQNVDCVTGALPNTLERNDLRVARGEQSDRKISMPSYEKEEEEEEDKHALDADET